MNRLDLLPVNNFVATVKDMLTELDNIKKRQNVGSDSLVLYLSYTASHNPPNWDIPNISIAAYAQKTITIKFTPDSQKPIYAELSFAKQYFPSSGYETIELYPDPAGQNLPNGAVQWVFIFTNDYLATLLQLDVVVKSTDTGVITYTIS